MCLQGALEFSGVVDELVHLLVHLLLVSDRLYVVPEELFGRTVVPKRRENVAKRRVGRELRERFGLMGPALLGEYLPSDVAIEAKVRVQCQQTFGGLGKSLDLLCVELTAVLREDGARAEERHREVHASVADVLGRDHVLTHERRRDVPVLPLAGFRVEPGTPGRSEANDVTVFLDFGQRAAIGDAVLLGLDVAADEILTLENLVPCRLCLCHL